MFMKFIYHKVKNVTYCICQKVYMAQSFYGTKFIRHKVYTAQSLYGTKFTYMAQSIYGKKFIHHKVHNYKFYTSQSLYVTKFIITKFITQKSKLHISNPTLT
jgi:hypothetical protein